MSIRDRIQRIPVLGLVLVTAVVAHQAAAAKDTVFDATVPKGRDFRDVLRLMHELLARSQSDGGAR